MSAVNYKQFIDRKHDAAQKKGKLATRQATRPAKSIYRPINILGNIMHQPKIQNALLFLSHQQALGVQNNCIHNIRLLWHLIFQTNG